MVDGVPSLGMALDTERRRATPEGVTLGLRVAGAPARGLAWAIDLVVLSVLLAAIGLVAAALGNFGAGLASLVSFLLIWGYSVAFELLRDGRTPGKQVLGLRVVHDDGTPVAPPASILRNLLRFADFLPLAWGAGLVSMLVSRDSQRLGDLAAGTLVVHVGAEAHGAIPDAEPVALPVALSLPERSAIVSYASRSSGWSRDRAVELAEIVEPLTGARGQRGVDRLLGMARQLLGRPMAVGDGGEAPER